MVSWIDIAIPAVGGVWLVLNPKTRGWGMVLFVAALIALSTRYMQLHHH
jgi:hypothetical protein